MFFIFLLFSSVALIGKNALSVYEEGTLEQVLFEQWRHHQQWRNVDNVENGGARLGLLGTMTTVSEGEPISNVKTVARMRMMTMRMMLRMMAIVRMMNVTMMMRMMTIIVAEVEEVKKSHPCDKEYCFEVSF